MEAQAAQIQKKLQIELDSFKATQKGISLPLTLPILFIRLKKKQMFIIFTVNCRLFKDGSTKTTSRWSAE